MKKAESGSGVTVVDALPPLDVPPDTPEPVMAIDVAFVAVQVSTEDPPDVVIVDGFAVKDVITGSAGGVGAVATFTVTLAVTEPKLFLAVSV